MERLTVLRARVATLVARQSDASGGSDHPLRGLYLTHDQAIGLLDAGGSPGDPPLRPQPLGPQLSSVAQRCGLDAADIDVLIAALAPDIDSRFEKLYGYLHDDLTKRRATIGLSMTMCGLEPASPDDRHRFATSGGLSVNALVLIDSDGPFLSRTLRVPDFAADLLLGGTGCEPLLARFVVGAVTVEAPEIDAVADILESSVLVHLTEGIGGSAAHVASAAAASLSRAALIIDVSLAATDELDMVVGAVVRHQALTGAVAIIRPVEDLAERAPRATQQLAAGAGAVVFVGSRVWNPAWASTMPNHLPIDEPTPSALGAIWVRSLGAAAVDPGAVEAVQSSFRLSPEQIVRAATAVRSEARRAARLGLADLRAAARSQSAVGLDRLARRLEPISEWDDLILPHAVESQLRGLAVRVRWRDQVMQQWELGRGWRNRGIAALFAGPSGTGKTTAAEVIARDLGYDMHAVDLSSVVDKYIGETEKKLEVIFTEAERTNTVLLFDEADAIFGKRSEVKDARDRYANIEVSYLLQRIERFAGLAILTTNLGANLDEAFTRRLDVMIDFPRPDAAARERLWRHEFRPTVPTDGLDLEFCAVAFDLTGGSIRNTVITAAYLAAEAGRPVGMADVVAAVQREYRKMGRLCLASEFGRYADLLR